jgi:hypothetical protein
VDGTDGLVRGLGVELRYRLIGSRCNAVRGVVVSLFDDGRSLGKFRDFRSFEDWRALAKFARSDRVDAIGSRGVGGLVLGRNRRCGLDVSGYRLGLILNGFDSANDVGIGSGLDAGLRRLGVVVVCACVLAMLST